MAESTFSGQNDDAADVTAENETAENETAPEATPEATPEADAEAQAPADIPHAQETVELSELDQALLKVAELEEEIARRKADLYNLQQEYNGFVKRSKDNELSQRENGIAKVLDTLLSVLDDAALARQHGDLEGPAGTIVEKLESTLETNFKLVRFGAEGDPFDPTLHEALMNQSSPDVTEQQIAQLIQPGYKLGDRVLRPARVGVVSPE